MVTIQEKFDQEYSKDIKLIRFYSSEKLTDNKLNLHNFTQLRFLCITNLSQLKHLEIKNCPELEVVECPFCEVKVDNAPKLKSIKNNGDNGKSTVIVQSEKKGIDWPCVFAITVSVISLTIAIYFAWKSGNKKKK